MKDYFFSNAIYEDSSSEYLYNNKETGISTSELKSIKKMGWENKYKFWNESK